MSKYEQILCVTIWELDERAAKSNFVAQKVGPLAVIRNNKLSTQDEKLETSAKLRVFVSYLYSRGGVLPYMGYIGMCGPKGYGF